MWESIQAPSQPSNQRCMKIIVQSPQATSCNLKQIFNITYTHYCSTSIYKKLHNPKHSTCRKHLSISEIRDRNLSELRIKKKELNSANPNKKDILNFKVLEKRDKQCPTYTRRMVSQVKMERQEKDPVQNSSRLSSQNYPLKAQGHRINLNFKQLTDRQRISTSRPMTGKPTQSQAYGNVIERRLKTVHGRPGQEKDLWNGSVLVERGWEYQY